MRREYINYMPGVPVDISLRSINNCPMHWHNAIEIIFVLRGTLSVTIETQTYIVEEKEIEIINCDEAHAIKSMDKDNEILIFHLDPVFFERYYDDIKNVFFYTNSSVEGAQEAEKYYVLREYLSILLCEVVQEQEGYKENIQSTIVELIFHLINSFHQLIYEEERLKEDEVQFERYDRIVKYIYSNYMNKISLQDIAKREYLSTNYLSNKIKDAMGYGFNDFLNLTRVEESLKLLLDTDKTISEISEEMGFSHVRYFNKHFKKYYKSTPMQFRKKYRVDDEKFEKLKKIKVLDVRDALDYLSIYLEDYDRYYYENKIVKVDIDTSCEGKEYENSSLRFFDIGYAKELLYEKNKKVVECIQRNIGFDYCFISKLFVSDMNIFQNGNNEFIDWTRVKDVLMFLVNLDTKPVIILDESFGTFKSPVELLKNFIEYFCEVFGENKIQRWRFKLQESLNATLNKETRGFLEEYFGEEIIFNDRILFENAINPVYDTCYMMPYIIQNSIINTEYTLCPKAFDVLNENIGASNEILFGGTGLISTKGIKKPSYYAYYFLSLLGDEIIASGDGYVATRKDEDIQILLYSYKADIHKLINFEDIKKKRGIENTAERNYSINILNLQHDCKIIRYDLNEKLGSFYNYWVNLGKPTRLTEEEIDLINEAANPKISFAFAKKSTVYNIVSKVQGYGGALIIFKAYERK